MRAIRGLAMGVVLLVLGLGAKPRKAYLTTYESHTEHLIVYSGFATALNLRGTLLSVPMREALVRERKRLMNPSNSNHAAFSERMANDGAAYHEVVFSADSSMENGNRFGESDRGWTLRLLADGQEEELVSVERIRRPSALHHGLYPHINQWSELWIARFAKTTAPGRLELVVGSGYGNGSLTWTEPVR